MGLRRSESNGEEKILLSMPEIEPRLLGGSARSLVAVPTRGQGQSFLQRGGSDEYCFIRSKHIFVLRPRLSFYSLSLLVLVNFFEQYA